MPLIKRSVEPRNVSRGPSIASGVTSVQDELEFVSTSTLANVMRQLSSLSVRVDDMFGELNRESVAISRRTIALTERTERLRMKIVQLNPTVEPGHYCIRVIVTPVTPCVTARCHKMQFYIIRRHRSTMYVDTAYCY